MRSKWIFLLLLFFTPTFAAQEKRELVVNLPTRHFLHAIFLSPFSDSSSSEPNPHLTKLRDLLVFDLNRNGSVSVTEEQIGCDFSIGIEVVGTDLFTSVTSKKSGLCHSLPTFSIQGTLSSDRRLIHKLSDKLTEIITGIYGIARLRILYAVQFPEKIEEKTVWKSEIWEADYDGYNAHPITQEKNYCINPVYFPMEGAFSRNKLLYVNYKLGQSKIYITSFGQPKGEPFIKLRGNQLLPAISPKGDMIAFICDASGRADLFVHPFNRDHGLNGKPIQAFSFPHSVQASPTFRPDGKKIAFVSDKEKTPRIFLIDTPYPGSKKPPRPLCITKKYRHNTCPSWSPDGTKLAYSAMIDGIRQIVVYDFVSREEIQLTSGSVHKENPSWAPNSLHIIYNTVGTSSELFLINLKQKEAMQITSGSGKKHYPAWEPRKI